MIRPAWWGPRIGRLYYEYLHLRYGDPYGLRDDPYVEETYDRQLAVLGERRFSAGLEVGCSVGTLTERLSRGCDSLIATDISLFAVLRARRRLAGTPGVRVERRRLPAQIPSGPFDLIVCSEVLYYWTREELLGGARRLEAALAPGGTLLALHWRAEDPHRPLQGDEVHDLLGSSLGLERAVASTERDYRLDSFYKPAPP